MLYTDNITGRSFAKDPSVTKLGDEYFLYYTARTGDGEKLCIGVARSSDGDAWEYAARVMPEQECERNGLCAAGAIALGGRIHLFYQTYGNREHDAICHAVSSDGVNFTRDESNPVFSPSADWCCGRAIDADVCLFRGKLWLYFATRDHEFRTQKLGAAFASPDSGFGRGAWTQAAAQSVLHPEMAWEKECIEAPAALAVGDALYMFYGGAYNCSPQMIGAAYSSDGVFFTRLSPEPFMRNGAPGSWNASESGHPFAFRDGERVWLYYQGSPDGGESWYLSRAELSFGGGVPSLVADEK